ncbi:MAG: oxygen-independent coproporphyrinogen III oxidase [Lachnospiraceae bacterium]|jgi:oxygen-independent coproporphyrinogen-3 oxidase|nr:oxygen-independent coproporphyrinogen III oxidase [Lachnospiraceae bacterium]
MIKNKEKKNLGIYLHIPFCMKKCHYCDFLSAPADENTKERYIEALKKEIFLYREDLKENIISTIFLGGGTPSLLKEKQIKEILDAIFETYFIKKGAEITIEANPETLTKEKLKIYKEAGINRLSIGLQSTEEEQLKRLGRIHTYEKFLESYTLAREVGFENINVDLMSALPFQTKEEWEETLRKIVNLNPKPEHISAYSLIIEEGTKFFKIKEQLSFPDEEEDRQMYWKTKEFLEREGYHRYEISNYALPEKESRHNQTYWTLGEYLGLGLGAASYWNGSRFKNTENLQEYFAFFENNMIKELSELQKEVHILSKEEKMEEFMFLGLRRMKGISEKRFLNLFQKDIMEVYREKIEKGVQIGVLWRKDGRIGLTERGIDISNMVLTEFLF